MGKFNKFIKELQNSGFPIFFLRDPISKTPSVSLTMVVISFNLCLLSLINKAAKFVDGVDIDNSLELLIITSSLYFGRSLSKKINKEEINKEGE